MSLIACLSMSTLTASPRPEPVEHSLLTSDPGKVHIDLWGWETTPFYQRFGGRVASPVYVAFRAVDESYKWGANILEIYRGGFPLETRGGWTAESTAALHRHVHARGMTIHWFPHRINHESFRGSVDAIRELGEQFDVLTVPPEALLDGLGTEQWATMWASLFNHAAWPCAPHMYYYTDNHLFATTLPNEQDVSASNGYGTDDQTTGYYELHEQLRKEGGLQFWGSQIECRTGAMAGNSFGGLGYPDWVVKQLNDQFRPRARVRGARNISPSALWWINEAESVTPDDNRLYVYGCSQDPVKCAVTAKLAALGAEAVSADGRKLAQRYPDPAATAFIQNNYLRLLVRHDRDYATLLLDPERLAHYDDNSFAVRACEQFGRTLPAGADAGDPADTPQPVTFEHLEPAGYRAVLTARLRHDFVACAVDERRTFTVDNDAPCLRMRVERTVSGGPQALETRFDLSAYDTLVPDGAAHDGSFDGDCPAVLRFTDSGGALPEVTFLVVEPGGLTGCRWTPGGALVFESAPATQDRFELAVATAAGLYDDEGLAAYLEHLRAPVEPVRLDASGQARVTNPLDVPLVKTVLVEGADEHPYHVREFGRWQFRGGQPSQQTPGADYLKVYLPANGEALVQRYDFLEGAARAGWGCQYTVSVLGVESRQGGASAEVDVREVTSFLFAPRVQFAESVAEATVDGEPWRYFEGDTVFLPNHRGRHTVSVTYGEPNAPYLARTFACVEASRADGDALTFTGAHPEWTDSVPDDFAYHAAVQHPGRNVASLDGAELVRTVPGSGSVVRFLPGQVTLRFAPAEASEPMPSLDQEEDIRRLVAQRDALTVEMHLDNGAERVPVCALPDDLHEFGAVVWNHYMFGDDGVSMPDGAAERLAAYVQQGGGLVLIANAVRLAPGVGGEGVTLGETHHAGHRPNRQCEWAGIRPLRDEHPLFEGMDTVKTPLGAVHRLIEVGGWDVLKRVDMTAPEGMLVGEHLCHYERDEKMHPEAWEPGHGIAAWEFGKGRVVALAAGLRFGHGDPARYVPAEAAKRLVRNALKWAAGGQDRPRTGILW